MPFDIVHKHGHVELYINGKFYCSADTTAEAMREYNQYVEERFVNENKSTA